MALVGEHSRCPICHGRLDRLYTATSGIALLFAHRLFRFCDAPLHLDCLATWPDRVEFSRAYFLSDLAGVWRGRHGTLLKATPRWFLKCGPRVGKNPLYAEVSLRDWPFPLYSQWGEWTEFVAGDYRGDLEGAALEAADAVIAEIRHDAPTLQALEALLLSSPPPPAKRRSYVEFGEFLATLWGDEAHAIDWRAVDEVERAAERHREEEERARALAIARSNAVARRIRRELETIGSLRCPHCGRRSYDFRFINREPEEKSFFICGLCGRSFAGSEAS